MRKAELVCQRTRHQTMPLKWEFPGGKIEEGEQPRDALRRELEEELGIHAKVGDEIARLQHTYPNGGTVELRFFVVREYERRNGESYLPRSSVGGSEGFGVLRFSRGGCISGEGFSGWEITLRHCSAA